MGDEHDISVVWRVVNDLTSGVDVQYKTVGELDLDGRVAGSFEAKFFGFDRQGSLFTHHDQQMFDRATGGRTSFNAHWNERATGFVGTQPFFYTSR